MRELKLVGLEDAVESSETAIRDIEAERRLIRGRKKKPVRKRRGEGTC